MRARLLLAMTLGCLVVAACGQAAGTTGTTAASSSSASSSSASSSSGGGAGGSAIMTSDASASSATTSTSSGSAGSTGTASASSSSGASDAGGGTDGGSNDSVALHATSGWQVYPGGSYHYGPSILIDTDASIHMWTCSPGSNGAWDYVRYHHSTDGGHTWSADTVALEPTPGSADAYSTCDPGAVKIGSYFYIGYTSTTNSAGTQNNVFVARSTSPTGPFEKWNGSGWGGNPTPVITYAGDASYYGYGEPSLVLLGKKLFLYYTDSEAQGFTNVATVDDATVDAWPSHLVDHGHAIARTRPAEDSSDVKYVDALGVFVAVGTADRFSPNATLAAYQSSDGLSFTPIPYLGARAQIGAHNAGISGDLSGHLDVNASNFVAYAYQPVGNGWGNWPTYLDPITLGSAPWGLEVGGEVSSIVNGDDWGWSGPLAWDGDPTTVFSSNGHGTTCAAEEWTYVDVGAPRAIAGVTIVPRTMGYGFPVDFTLQTSPDQATWTTVPGQTYTAFANPGSAPVTFTFGASITAQYLRLDATTLGTDNNGGCYLQLAEITPLIAP